MEKPDARIIRTKQLLYDAFISLIKEKGFESVSVHSLTKQAGLNRGTFYLHYQDKFDLIDQIKEEKLAELCRIYTDLTPQSLIGHPSMDEPHPTILQIFNYFADNRDFFRVMLGPKGDPGFAAQIKGLMNEQLTERFYLHTEQEKMLAPLDIIIAYVTSANLGVIQYWLEKGQYSAHYMAVLLTRIAKLGPLELTGIQP